MVMVLAVGPGVARASVAPSPAVTTTDTVAPLPTVAVEGPDQTLWVYWQAANAQWYGPLGVGATGSTFSSPSLAYGPDGLPTVAVQGPDQTLWVYWQAANAQWYGPLGVGATGSTFSSPSLAYGPDGLPTVAVEGPDHALWAYWQATSAQWYGPLGVGATGSTFSSPSLAYGPDGLPTVAVEGPDQTLWAYWQATDAQWYGPLGVGATGSDFSSPSLAFGSGDLPIVAVEGPDDSLSLYSESSSAQWSAPLEVGGADSTHSSPSLALGPGGLPTLAVEGPDDSLWLYSAFSSAQWNAPLEVGGSSSTYAAPSLAFGAGALPTVAAQGPDGTLWVYWQAADAQWYGPLGVGATGSTFSAPSLAVSSPPGRSSGGGSGVSGWAEPGTVIANLDTAPGSPYTPGEKVIALTFDDGPSPIYTPEILQVLSEYHVPASFEVVGEHGAQYPEFLRLEAALGMALVDHTWTHVDLATLPASEWGYQVDQTDALLQSVTGELVGCLRPPYGYTDSAVVAQLGQRGLAELMWDVDPSDYLMPGAPIIAQRVLSALHPGAIVILHDGGGDRSQTVAALPPIISGAEEAGYQFVQVCQG
jgi:peptidoglycan/xylan/chitin deacetylase (PgdA/CDA1 family)